MAKGGKGEKKGKKKKVKKAGYKIGKMYESGKAKNKKCPRGHMFMANHKNRWVCGKCGYTEMK